MRRRALTATAVAAGIALAAWVAPALAAGSPNYATTTESALGLYYDGYVQCQPSYVQAKQHAAQGWLRYNIPGGADSGRQYTGKGTGPTDSRIYSKSYRFYDTLSPVAPATQFTYGFNWVPDGSPWPYSLDIE